MPKHVQTHAVPTWLVASVDFYRDDSSGALLPDCLPPAFTFVPPPSIMASSNSRYRVFESRTLVEEEWSNREELFKVHGYNFRPRLRKGWTPSWLDTDKSAFESEDSHMLRVRRSLDPLMTVLIKTQTHLVDAFTDDGRVVCIKEVSRNDEESRIARMLSTNELNADPRNHCVPVIEVIDDPEHDTKSYMVMPFLRSADDPPFQSVKEIVDFVDQVLEVRTNDSGRHGDLTLIVRAWSSCTRRGSLTGNVHLCSSVRRAHISIATASCTTS